MSYQNIPPKSDDGGEIMFENITMERDKRIGLLREVVLSRGYMDYVKSKTIMAVDHGKAEHTIVDRARDFERYWRESDPFIQDWELIVGGYSLNLSEESTLNPGRTDGHNIPNYAKALNMGFEGIRKRAKSLVAKISDKYKRYYYEAVDIAYAAASDFVRRHAVLAEAMATIESDPQRKGELLKISQVCADIATEPASSFLEALQLLWFATLFAGNVPRKAIGVGPVGRIDQYLLPFYERDIQKGTITKEQAQELLECLWIKFSMRARQGETTNNLFLGGLTPDGRDAANELTYMCLEATAKVRLAMPKVNIRIHVDSDRELLEETCRVISLGLGMPAIYSDKNAIPAMMATGLPLEEARNYMGDGCTELALPGNADLAFYLCPTITESYDFLVNADVENLKTFDEFLWAYKKHFASLFKKHCVPVPVMAKSSIYSPFYSALFDDCLERGMPDLRGGVVYSIRGAVLKGIVNCIDSLAAIKKLIYDEKTVTWDELLAALRANYEGYEPLRQKLLNDAPKFGNDDDYVDSIAVDLVDYLADEATKYETGTGLRYAIGLLTWLDQGVEHEVPSADGRRAYDLIASNFSPSPGRDKNGPTAIIRSVNKIDSIKAGHGTALDLKFHPSALAEDGFEKFISFVDTVLNGDHVITLQINVVDSETLMKAREKPEEYRDLLIRVRGFSTYFVELNPWLQDQIIARTELSL